ncbi:unnamed protein product [Rotaria sp. Silwood1]|nr:unnamed protein product [Rotaria sp. Silwood1]CAF1302895.1 unnamed protein product [Rotaria sp. Silwood1]
MGFFIGDLYRHIEELHTKQFGNQQSTQEFRVYRGQGLAKVDLEQIMQTKGGLMSFHNFLSTSKVENVSLDFARRALSNPDRVGILFVMLIDSSKSSTPFASITDVSVYQDTEDEVLFSMNTVFRIGDVKQMDENSRLWQVDLTLTSDHDPELHILTERIREETFPDSEGWERLGLILIRLGHSGKAEEVYEMMLEQASNDREKAGIYHQIGSTKRDKGEYREAIANYEKSLEIRQQFLGPNHPSMTRSYNNIGLVYHSMGEYSKALTYHEKALEIRQKSLRPDDPVLASSYNNIGMVYENIGEYSQALSHYQKALEIRQKSLPPNHPELASSYNNIGNTYGGMGENSKELLYHEKALEIRQRTLPPDHPDLAFSYNNIGSAYAEMGEYTKALSSFEKAIEIRQKSLPPNHPDLALSYNSIGTVYELMGNYPEALSFYERAVNSGQRSLPSYHPHLQLYIKNLENMRKEMIKIFSFSGVTGGGAWGGSVPSLIS